MNAADLFNLAPLGALVRYSDGTPEPPARHVKKLRDWQSRNSSGYFTQARQGDPGVSYSPSRFTLQQDRSAGLSIGLTVNRLFTLDSKLDFEVTPPAPGTIIAHRKLAGEVEVAHVWADLHAARKWAGGFYKFANCGLAYWLVGEDGSLTDYMPED